MSVNKYYACFFAIVIFIGLRPSISNSYAFSEAKNQTAQEQIINSDIAAPAAEDSYYLVLLPIFALMAGFLCSVMISISVRRKYKKRKFRLFKRKKDLLEEEKNRNDFIENISHELRSPAHSILNFSKMGISRIETDEKEKLLEYFQDIRESSERLIATINNLLDFSKFQSGKFVVSMEECDISEITRNSINILKSVIAHKNIKITVKNHNAPTKMMMDYGKIALVMNNLINNAVKFTPENKSVNIEFCEIKEYRKKSLLVSVLNEGSFLAPEEREVVFERFIQGSNAKSDFPGTGIGLSLCREIVHLHGGNIWIESDEKTGTTIKYTIPID